MPIVAQRCENGRGERLDLDLARSIFLRYYPHFFTMCGAGWDLSEGNLHVGKGYGPAPMSICNPRMRTRLLT
jgi:hypothetical protein